MCILFSILVSESSALGNFLMGGPGVCESEAILFHGVKSVLLRVSLSFYYYI
jgi:hypothetical protein